MAQAGRGLGIRGRQLGQAGLAVAWTPIAAFLAGVINPSALEISSALLVWTAGLFLVRPVALPAWLRGRVVWHFAAASALFVVSRQLWSCGERARFG